MGSTQCQKTQLLHKNDKLTVKFISKYKRDGIDKRITKGNQIGRFKVSKLYHDTTAMQKLYYRHKNKHLARIERTEVNPYYMGN